MNIYLKYGGLTVSAGLTVSLFLRLFGFEAYGIILGDRLRSCCLKGGTI